MSFPRTRLVLVLGFLLAAIGTGCQSSTKSSGMSMAAPQKALVITGQGGQTVVLLPNADNTDVEMMSASGNMTMCPQCKADAIKYFQTGEITPKCSVCGATRTPVNYIPPSPTAGHN